MPRIISLYLVISCLLASGFSTAVSAQQAHQDPTGVSIENIEKAIELFSISRRAKLQGKTLIASKKFREARSILIREFPAGKVITATDKCPLVKRGNRQIRLSCYRNYKPLNKELIFTFNSTVDDNSGIAADDVTRDVIVERVENAQEEDAIFFTETPGTAFTGRIKLIRHKNGLTETCSLKTNPNTDEVIIEVHCRILGLQEAARTRIPETTDQ